MISQRKALRTAYPDILTLSDITKILKISKRKAAWMLQNGYIKNINSGKKTRQYQVRINDLFEYMDKVERNDPSIQIPLGLFNANVIGQKNGTSVKHSETLPCVQKNLKEDFKVWLDNEWADVPEMLTVTDISKISGYISLKLTFLFNCARFFQRINKSLCICQCNFFGNIVI